MCMEICHGKIMLWRVSMKMILLRLIITNINHSSYTISLAGCVRCAIFSRMRAIGGKLISSQFHAKSCREMQWFLDNNESPLYLERNQYEGFSIGNPVKALFFLKSILTHSVMIWVSDLERIQSIIFHFVLGSTKMHPIIHLSLVCCWIFPYILCTKIDSETRDKKMIDSFILSPLWNDGIMLFVPHSSSYIFKGFFLSCLWCEKSECVSK
jgi:hypothetical protein